MEGMGNENQQTLYHLARAFRLYRPARGLPDDVQSRGGCAARDADDHASRAAADVCADEHTNCISYEDIDMDTNQYISSDQYTYRGYGNSAFPITHWNTNAIDTNWHIYVNTDRFTDYSTIGHADCDHQAGATRDASEQRGQLRDVAESDAPGTALETKTPVST